MTLSMISKLSVENSRPMRRAERLIRSRKVTPLNRLVAMDEEGRGQGQTGCDIKDVEELSIANEPLKVMTHFPTSLLRTSEERAEKREQKGHQAASRQTIGSHAGVSLPPFSTAAILSATHHPDDQKQAGNDKRTPHEQRHDPYEDRKPLLDRFGESTAVGSGHQWSYRSRSKALLRWRFR